MDRLWSPWRYAYVSAAGPAQGCIFCEKTAEQDASNYIVHRGRKNCPVEPLSLHDGSVMIAPYEHVAHARGGVRGRSEELMTLGPGGPSGTSRPSTSREFQRGMNMKCAGASVAGHIHMHVVPALARRFRIS
jgi:ATP adenylyltransferase